MTALVVRGDAAHLPLPDQSVDLIVTSPPYFALRSYTDGGEHYAGQIGSEATPQEFLEALWSCTREWMRVLKPSGSIWVNLGDKYANAAPSGSAGYTNVGKWKRPTDHVIPDMDTRAFARQKSLMGMPWRYAIGCIDQLGLILRAEVIWSKPNGLPESVTDRVRRSHEQFFHFTKQPRYFAAVDEIREEYSERVIDRQRYAGRPDVPLSKDRGDRGDGNPAPGILGHGHRGLSPLGKLPGSVWEIPSEPLTVPGHLGVDHFTAFPTEWPRRIILGWSPSGVCTACGEGCRPTLERTSMVVRPTPRRLAAQAAAVGSSSRTLPSGTMLKPPTASIVGYACACPDDSAPTRPSVVLDPFGGTGTTALCASVLGRTGISVDLSGDYSRLARWRTQDPASRAKAMRVEKPPVELVGQDDLFGTVAG